LFASALISDLQDCLCFTGGLQKLFTRQAPA
jgi:hypothetical protein